MSLLLSARRRAFLRRRTQIPRRGSMLPTRLVLIAACLAAVFAGSIVVEAMDYDLALWPIGGDAFVAPAHGILPILDQSLRLGVHRTLPLLVSRAGDHLVAQHRARGALEAESSLFITADSLADC